MLARFEIMRFYDERTVFGLRMRIKMLLWVQVQSLSLTAKY